MVTFADLPIGLRSSAAFYTLCLDHVINHPTHVVLETLLCLFIFVVLVVKREYDPRKRCVWGGDPVFY